MGWEEGKEKRRGSGACEWMEKDGGMGRKERGKDTKVICCVRFNVVGCFMITILLFLISNLYVL
jgi:hypothetical protein